MTEQELDETTRRFLRIVTSDPDLDFRLGRVLMLFGTEMPVTHGGYAHHGWGY
jgi:hypothetical protein